MKAGVSVRLSVIILVAFVSWGDAWMTRSTAGRIRGVRSSQLRGWSRQAWIEVERRRNGTNFSIDDVRIEDCIDLSRDKNLASPRKWLESLPDGAYTVLRCDHLENGWMIWGRDFHMTRLRDSFQSLTKHSNLELSAQDLARLERETAFVLEILLSKVENDDITSHDTERGSLVDSFMVTFLWLKDTGIKRLCSRGHIVRLATTNPLEYNPVPVIAATALDDNSHGSLPSRMPDPNAKLSSWCSRRRPLEQRFKNSSSVGEVLLVSPLPDGDYQLLEGLTSNVFVLYSDGVLRTAGSKVLPGYARLLVLESAKRLGIPTDTSKPIALSESEQWQEVFVTSAVKLITPVNEIRVSSSQQLDAEDKVLTVWEKGGSIWSTIYRDILSNQTRYLAAN